MPAGAIPFPFGECRICNDKATGVHYGVATCEGCKGFFKRSTTKSEKYKCFFGSQCVITPQNRNRCKYCRYKQCLQKGMAIDAVKMGRIPKIDKERALEAARGIGHTDEGHQSSSDSGISDTTCQQIAERIFPILPNGYPSPPESGDPALRNSGTPCSVTSGVSDTFTLQSASGKRWHYSSEMIRELLNQVIGSPNGKNIHQSVLKKFLRNLNQQQDFMEKSAAFQDSGIDSPSSAEFQSICKKLVKATHADEINSKYKDLNSLSVKEEVGNTCNPAPFSGMLSPVNDPNSEMFPSGMHTEHTPMKKRMADPPDEEPPMKVSTLEALLRNQFLPPSKLEDIDRFLSDAVRHSGLQQTDNYDELLDTAVSVTKSANILSGDLMQDTWSDGQTTEPFLVPSVLNHGNSPNMSYTEMSDSFVLPSTNTLSSPVETSYFTSQHLSAAVSSSHHHHQNSGYSNYNPQEVQGYPVPCHDIPSFNGAPISNNAYSHQSLAYEVSHVPYNCKSKPLPSTSYSINGFAPNADYGNMNSTLEKSFPSEPEQFRVNTMTSASGLCTDVYPHTNTYHKTITGLDINISPSKELTFEDLRSEVDNEAVKSSHSQQIFESSGKDISLMERTLERLCEADVKHNDFLRKNKEWMVNFITKGGHHASADKSQAGIEKTWNQLIGSVQPVNARIIGFCNDVPGFNRLEEADRKAMIGKAYYDIWMVYSVPFLRNGESYLQFPDGEPYTREWMTHFLSAPFVEIMFDFADRLNECNLTDIELGILCAIQLTAPDREGVRRSESAVLLHSHYLDVLDYAMAKAHPNNHSRILIDIFKLLPQLSKINELQQEIVANFAVDGPPGMSKGECESPEVETINDLQNKFREEMDKGSNSDH